MSLLLAPITFAVRLAAGVLLLFESLIGKVISYLTPGYARSDGTPLFIQTQNGSGNDETVVGLKNRGTKRVKILLEIDIDGSNDAQIVTATEVVPSPPFLFIRWFISCLEIVRETARYFRIRLEQIARRISPSPSAEAEADNTNTQSETVDPPTSTPGPSNGNQSERKMKSPRKRLSEIRPNTSIFPLKLMSFFGISNRSEPSTVSFVMPSAEELLKLKNKNTSKADLEQSHTEKRKLSVTSDDDEEESETPVSPTSENENSENGSVREAHPDITLVDPGAYFPLKRSQHRDSLVKFMEADEPDESVDDPNYSPNEDELNASSTTNETLDEEERNEEIEKLNGLNGLGDLRNGNDHGEASSNGTENAESSPAGAAEPSSSSSTASSSRPADADATVPADNEENPVDVDDVVTPGRRTNGKGKSKSKSPRAHPSPSAESKNGKVSATETPASPAAAESSNDDPIFFDTSCTLFPFERTETEGRDEDTVEFYDGEESLSRASSPFSYHSSEYSPSCSFSTTASPTFTASPSTPR